MHKVDNFLKVSSVRIHFTVSELEKKIILNVAGSKDMTCNEYIRSIIRKELQDKIEAAEKDYERIKNEVF